MKIPSKLKYAKSRFSYDEEGTPELKYYGQFMHGLTNEEIKDYLRVRANKSRIETIYKKFCDIAGVNTVAIYQCPNCREMRTLMYRHDVQRFADVLFLGVPTYFD
jgi:hypothetical protein